MSSYVYLCENSIDGVFSGIYDAWESRLGHSNIRLLTNEAEDNFDLFCEYVNVAVDYEKSLKVARTLIARLGQEVYEGLCQAVSAFESEKEREKEISKADAVYKTIVLGFAMKNGARVLEHLANPYVNRVFQLCRATTNEAHHLLGFLRFRELENGILFAKIHPKHDVLVLLAEHFSDRLPIENFIIYDENRKMAVIHKKDQGYFLTDVPNADEAFMKNYSEKEGEYQKLWTSFFHTIAIEARVNPRLQRHFLRERFMRDMVEWKL
jgi:probable DNA metabolism protein